MTCVRVYAEMTLPDWSENALALTNETLKKFMIKYLRECMKIANLWGMVFSSPLLLIYSFLSLSLSLPLRPLFRFFPLYIFGVIFPHPFPTQHPHSLLQALSSSHFLFLSLSLLLQLCPYLPHFFRRHCVGC